MKLTNKILEAVNRGIKFALDDYEDNNIQGLDNSKVNYKGGTKEWLDLMNDVVDLDLPSGTLWCKYNLDVNPNQLTKLEDWYGGYYAWGELESNKTNKDNKSCFEWNNYKFGKNYKKLTKYCNNFEYGLNCFDDNLILILPEDDAAYQNKHLYNYKFHIPTKEQFEELLKNTKNYWVNNYDPNKIKHNPEDDGGIQDLNGRIFEGLNGNQLFVPVAGSCSLNFKYAGSGCYLWTSSLYLDVPSYAYALHFYSNTIAIDNRMRCVGFSIRPVINL